MTERSYTTVNVGGYRVTIVDSGTEVHDENSGVVHIVTETSHVRMGDCIWCVPKVAKKFQESQAKFEREESEIRSLSRRFGNRKINLSERVLIAASLLLIAGYFLFIFVRST